MEYNMISEFKVGDVAITHIDGRKVLVKNVTYVDADGVPVWGWCEVCHGGKLHYMLEKDSTIN